MVGYMAGSYFRKGGEVGGRGVGFCVGTWWIGVSVRMQVR